MSMERQRRLRALWEWAHSVSFLKVGDIARQAQIWYGCRSETAWSYEKQILSWLVEEQRALVSTPSAPDCPRCGSEMEFDGTIESFIDGRLYDWYVCPRCDYEIKVSRQ